MPRTTKYSTEFFSGVGGRVYSQPAGEAKVILGWVKEWSMDVKADIYGAPTFESPTSNQGGVFVMWDLMRFTGLAEGSVNLKGYAMSPSGVADLFPEQIVVGGYYFLDLCLHVANQPDVPESNTYWVQGVGVVCKSVKYSQNSEGTNCVEFDASFEVDGVAY